jgi:hypothetical protein
MLFEVVSKFLSKVSCCRRRQNLSVATLEQLRQEQQSIQEQLQLQEYITQRRRRRNSPKPRSVATQSVATQSRMVANMNIPRLVVAQIDNLEHIEQHAQFDCPDGSARDICWDIERRVVVILSGRDEEHHMVDCSNTNTAGQDLTLREVLDILGFSMNTHMVTELSVYEGEMILENALDTPVETLPLMQFTIEVRGAPQC